MSTIEQSAAIPYRLMDDKLSVLLITARGGKKWIFPKGIIDPGDTEVITAQKECFEEAGVNGKLLNVKIGEYTYTKWGSLCRVSVFALKVENEYPVWDEMTIRKRKWLTLEAAIKKIGDPNQKIMLESFKKIWYKGNW